MLQKIREKAQGAFAWGILIMICVPFALWGIQNYVDVGQEIPVASVGDKDFFQRDINRAYNQFSEQYAGQGISEADLKEQALKKLISDEVLLQYVQDQKLTVTDDTIRSYIRSLPYFQEDGQFNKNKYQNLLAAQKLSSSEFAGRIKNALIMGQFQNSIVNSAFATTYEVDNFFLIQNQLRDIEFVSIMLPEVSEVINDEEIQAYYQEHQDLYQSPEKVSFEYIELSLDELAKQVEPDEEQLLSFYEDQKDLYSSKERRKISHILFKFSKDSSQDAAVLERAKQAKIRSQTEDFTTLAAQLSEDKLTSKKGGDLGLFSVGDMEPAFEEAAVALQEGEISEPVKSAFGYHIIKVTELTPQRQKTFDEAKQDVTLGYTKSQAENTFFELGETLTEVSYENSDSLSAVADIVGLEIKTADLFSRGDGVDMAAEPAIEAVAFSEDVLSGNNSEPIELGSGRLVVLRLLQHQPAAPLPLDAVKTKVTKTMQVEKASQQAQTLAEQVKASVIGGQSFQAIAEQQALSLQKVENLTRNNGDVPYQLNQAVFKAAKPAEGQMTTDIVTLVSGERIVFSLLKVAPGEITESEKKQLDLASFNIARVIGQSTFAALLQELESSSDVDVMVEN